MSLKDKISLIEDEPDKQQNELILYWDMDGVVANFRKGVNDMTSYDLSTTKDLPKEELNKFWSEVHSAGHFYKKLDPIPEAIDILKKEKEKGIKCEMLTGIPLPKTNPDASQDKKDWAKEHISEGIPVHTCFAKYKVKYCTGPECVLIDDSEKNCKAWSEAGGTAILFDGNINKLKEELINIKDKYLTLTEEKPLPTYIDELCR